MSSILDLELGIDAQTAKLHIYDNHIKFEVFGGSGLLCGALYHLDFTFANSLTQIFKIFAQYFIHVTNANHCQSQASSVMLFAIIFTAMHTFPNKHVRMIRYSI